MFESDVQNGPEAARGTLSNGFKATRTRYKKL